MRAIALATTRTVHSGEELFSSYLTVVSDWPLYPHSQAILELECAIKLAWNWGYGYVPLSHSSFIPVEQVLQVKASVLGQALPHITDSELELMVQFVLIECLSCQVEQQMFQLFVTTIAIYVQTINKPHLLEKNRPRCTYLASFPGSCVWVESLGMRLVH